MKKIKILAFLIALSLCVSVLASCDLSGLLNEIPELDQSSPENTDSNLFNPGDGYHVWSETGKPENTEAGEKPQETEANNKNEETKEYEYNTAGEHATSAEKHIHKIEYGEEVPPTCTETGKSGGTCCVDCGEWFEVGYEIPALGHDFDENYVCKRCGEAMKPTEGMSYDLSEDGREYILYDIGDAKDRDILIPSHVDGIPVTVIDSKAFEGYEITSVVIPSTVKVIGERAFADCYMLSRVTIPEGVESIGAEAFRCCQQLTSITVPSSAVCIDYGAFAECASLSEVILSEGLETISYDAFASNYTLKEISIPDSVRMIEYDAFYGCSSLEKVNIGENSRLAYISSSTFRDCAKLAYNEHSSAYYLGNDENPYLVLLKAKNQKIRTCDVHVNTRCIASNAFEQCESMRSVTLPEGLAYIGENAFHYCLSLTSISVPESVEEIGFGAFSRCSALESITLPFIGASAEINVDDPARSMLTYIFGAYSHNYVPEGMPGALKSVNLTSGEAIPDYAFYNCGSIEDITLPESIKSIGRNAFNNCSSLTSIHIPAGIETIGDYAFSGCNLLADITLPQSLTRIGDYMFSNCRSLQSITIPENVKSIGNMAFYGCSAITSIVIPDSVESIGYGVFQGMSQLSSITVPFVGSCEDAATEGYFGYFFQTEYGDYSIPDSIRDITVRRGTRIDCRAFANMYYVTSISLPDTITSIEEEAFYNCNSLQSITLYDGLERIESKAFYQCYSLTGMVIPEGVTAIGDNAFYDCNKMESLSLPSTLKTIGEGAFDNCTSLTSVIIPDGVEEIGFGAFINCTSLESIKLPFAGHKKSGEGATNFGYIFGAADHNVQSSYQYLSLRTVEITGGTTVPAYAFYNSYSLESIILPETVESIGEWAFYGCNAITEITLPESVCSIGEAAFYECYKLASINYGGTKAEWAATKKGDSWDYGLPKYVISCSDGEFVYTIPEVVSFGDTKYVAVTGTVQLIYTPWDADVGYMSVAIVDDAGNQLYVFQTTAELVVGDVVTVRGYVWTENGVKMINSGSVATVLEHVDYEPHYTSMTIEELREAAPLTLFEIRATISWYASKRVADDGQMHCYGVDVYDESESYFNISDLLGDVNAGDIVILRGYINSIYPGSAIYAEAEIVQSAE